VNVYQKNEEGGDMEVLVRWRRILPALVAPLICGLVVAASALAEDDDAASSSEKKPNDSLVAAKVLLSVDRLPAGRTCEVAVLLDIRPEWHINQNPSEPKFLIPTKLTLTSKHGTTLPQVRYPKGRAIRIEGIEQPLMVYEKQVSLRGVIEVPRDAAGLTEELEFQVQYQACNDKECKAPTKLKLGGKIAVAPPGEAVREINKKHFPKVEP